MLSKLRDALSATHISLVLLGIVLTAGIAWGTGTHKLVVHDRDITELKARVNNVEQEQRSEIREMRREINQRLEHIENLVQQRNSR